MEIEELRQAEEKQAEKEWLKKERERERCKAKSEIVKQKAREFTARKRAGLLTPEEQEADSKRMAKRAEYNKTYRDKQMEGKPPKPPKPPAKQEIIRGIVASKKEGLPLTPEESEIYAAYREKENAKARKRWDRIRENAPPKPVTTSDVLRKYKEGHELTQEQVLYDDYREMRRGVSKRQYQKRKAAAALVEKPPKPYKMTITSIMNRRREGLPLTDEETAVYNAYREKKTEYQREWRSENDNYYRDYKKKRKAEMANAVGQ